MVKDKVSMEYEARVMVSEEDYYLIQEAKLEEGKPVKHLVNENIYFDNEERYLTNHHIVLRIRTIDSKEHELTLKIKGQDGDVEITTILDQEQYLATLKDEIIKDENIINELKKRNIDHTNLHIVAQLLTYRTEIDYDKYLLVIDKNQYNGKIDFNIEVESTSREDALKYLKKIIKPYGVQYKKDYISKSRRAILKL